METFYKKIQDGEIEATLRLPCSADALSQAEAKMITLYSPLPDEYVKFLSEHNGFQGADDITLFYVADPESTIETLRSKTAPMELLVANANYHQRGLPDSYVVVGECDLGLFVYDSEEKEYVIIDPDGFDEFDGYETLEDMLLDMADPEYFAAEADDEEEE